MLFHYVYNGQLMDSLAWRKGVLGGLACQSLIKCIEVARMRLLYYTAQPLNSLQMLKGSLLQNVECCILIYQIMLCFWWWLWVSFFFYLHYFNSELKLKKQTKGRTPSRADANSCLAKSKQQLMLPGYFLHSQQSEFSISSGTLVLVST